MIKVVSVIIISYNTVDLTIRCLTQLYQTQGQKLEVFVVDNGSTDKTVETIKSRFNQVKVISNSDNVGFGRANNQAMKLATGKYFLLLNSDCFVEKDTVSTLITAMEAIRNVDVLGCKLLNSDGSLQPSYGYFPNLTRIAALMTFVDNFPVVNRFFPSIHVREPSRYQAATNVDWVMGALMLVKREVFEKTGGFDENYFMYGEEVEWMKRARAAGFRVMYVPQTTAVHIGGASSPNKAPALIGEIVSWKYFFGKYYPSWQRFIMAAFVTLGCGLRILLKPEYSKYYRTALREVW